MGGDVIGRQQRAPRGIYGLQAEERVPGLHLLDQVAAVHVKSQYDRGCDWSMRVYFVDAKDYQFE